MDYIYRLKCRVEDEGLANTIRYGTYVCSDWLHRLFRDTIFDLKYSGRLLSGNKKTEYKHMGANDVYHTDYSAMPLIFRHITISPEDVLVDVGCGKGRVINYWLSQKLKNKIIGLELDPEIARRTAAQFSRKRNVEIIEGDAISNLPQDGTVFYFYNPFEKEKVEQFEKRVAEISKSKSVKVIYYNPKSINAFNDEKWGISFVNFEDDLGVRRWGRINKYHDLAIISRKNAYS